MPQADAEPSPLTSAVLTTLDRPPHPHLIARPFGSLVHGLLSAGLYPAWAESGRLAKASRWRRSVVAHADELLRLRGIAGEPPARSTGRTVGSLTALARVLTVAAAGAAVGLLVTGAPLRQLWLVDPFRATEPEVLQVAFLALLGLAYFSIWIGANLHALQTPGFEGSDGSPRRWDFGLSVLPTTTAAVLAYVGVTWALPLTVAAVTLRRVVTRGDARALARLAAHVRAGVGEVEPASLPAPVGRVVRCPHAGCPAAYASGAQFCPRCGRSADTE